MLPFRVAQLHTSKFVRDPMNTPRQTFSKRRDARLFHLLCGLVVAHGFTGSLSALIIVVIPGIESSVSVGNLRFDSAFIADSFSFGVERSTQAGGTNQTEDINIGIGELQECTISKSMDSGSTLLAQFAINGNSPGAAEIFFVETAGGASGVPYVYLQYKLDRCFVKSWSTSGDADDRPTEEVSFYYNKIAFAYRSTTDGVNFKTYGPMAWDAKTQMPWEDPGITFEPPAPPR